MPPPAPEAPRPAGGRAAPRAGSTRRDPYVLLALALILLALRVFLGVRDARSTLGAAGAGDTGDRVRWRPFAAAVEEARATQRPLLYDFSAAWCGPCRRMQQEVFADPRVAADLEERFVPVRVVDRTREDGRNPAWVDSLQRGFDVRSFPTLVVQVIGEDGRPPTDGTGEPVRIEGYMGREFTLSRIAAAANHLRLRIVVPPRSTPTVGP